MTDDTLGSMDDVMPGGRFASPVRRGDTVERTPGRGRDNVHALLSHLEEVGFPLSPRYLGDTSDGDREVLTYLEGATGYPPLSHEIRSDAALVSVGRAIRSLHDATAGLEDMFADRADGWAPLEVAAPVHVDCIGHRDLAPWNMVFDGVEVVGIIDWDAAGPSSRAWDLAYAAFQFVPMHAPHPSRGIADWGWPTEPDRRGRLRLLCESYGGDMSPVELIDLAAIRVAAIAAHMEQRICLGDPAFETHRFEGHAAGYRGAAAYVIAQRDNWV